MRVRCHRCGAVQTLDPRNDFCNACNSYLLPFDEVLADYDPSERIAEVSAELKE